MDPEHHILLVEDDAATREAMAPALEMSGYTVAGAANGQEAIDHLRGDGRPCLILLDLMMPVKDGWQFRAEQQQDPSLAGIPVVVVSADGTVDQKAVALGAAGYLQKPVEVDQLLSVVRRHC
jgi:CheY-like chemotaxis protein